MPVQSELLANLIRIQHQQMQVLEAQREQLVVLSEKVNAAQSSDGLFHTKVENVNMPFFAMMGFMLKWAFASIPAALIMLAVTFGVTVLFWGVCGGLLLAPLAFNK